MNELLTIYIPTYNRHELLREQLRNIFHGLTVDETNNLKVIVSNNGSPIKIEDFPLAELFEHNNVGSEGNYIGMFLKNITRYSWLLSDDDILLPGAVKSVLNILSKSPDIEPNIIYFVDSPISPTSNSWGQQEFITFLNHGLGKISNVIYSKHFLSSAKVFCDDMFTGFAQLSYIFHTAKNQSITVNVQSCSPYFKVKAASPNLSPNGYIHSLYGFICACRRLSPPIFKKIASDWWGGKDYRNMACHPNNLTIAPTQALMCFCLLYHYGVITLEELTKLREHINF